MKHDFSRTSKQRLFLFCLWSTPEANDRGKICLCSEEKHNHAWINADALALPRLIGFRLTTRISAYADQLSTHQGHVQKPDNPCQCVFLGQSGMWLPALQSHFPLQHPLAMLSETDSLEAVELPRLLMGRLTWVNHSEGYSASCRIRTPKCDPKALISPEYFCSCQWSRLLLD